MAVTERRKSDRRKPTRLTPEQDHELRAYLVEQLGEDAVKSFARWTDAQRLELYEAKGRHLAKLAAAEKKEASLRALFERSASESCAREALAKGGAGRNTDLLLPQVTTRVRVELRDGEDGGSVGYQVVDRHGNVRFRDGRPMTVDELINDLRRMPELEGLFTKNGRHA